MRRVTKGKIVFLTYDPAFRGFWLADYFPALVTLDEGQMPEMARYGEWLEPAEISTVPIPHDCVDRFWRAIGDALLPILMIGCARPCRRFGQLVILPTGWNG